jgi:hypothetical protein
MSIIQDLNDELGYGFVRVVNTENQLYSVRTTYLVNVSSENDNVPLYLEKCCHFIIKNSIRIFRITKLTNDYELICLLHDKFCKPYNYLQINFTLDEEFQENIEGFLGDIIRGRFKVEPVVLK